MSLVTRLGSRQDKKISKEELDGTTKLPAKAVTLL